MEKNEELTLFFSNISKGNRPKLPALRQAFAEATAYEACALSSLPCALSLFHSPVIFSIPT